MNSTVGMFSGPALEEIHDELVQWYLDTRRALIEMMEESRPYGAIELDPEEQLHRAVTMTPEEWQQELGRIQLRYRGEPDAEEKVAAAVQEYLTHIKNLAQARPGQVEEDIRGS